MPAPRAAPSDPGGTVWVASAPTNPLLIAAGSPPITGAVATGIGAAALPITTGRNTRGGAAGGAGRFSRFMPSTTV